jgi:hypothetical protein
VAIDRCEIRSRGRDTLLSVFWGEAASSVVPRMLEKASLFRACDHFHSLSWEHYSAFYLSGSLCVSTPSHQWNSLICIVN